MSDERLARVSREAREKAAIVVADSAENLGPVELVAHLRATGHLTVGFIFRSILSGKMEIVRAALADLAEMPLLRVDAMVGNCEGTAFASLYRKAALPAELLPAFRIALQSVREVDWTMRHGASLSRTIVERVLTACESINRGELDKLIVLLRRFEAEAARDEVRAAPLRATALAPLTLKTSGSPPPLLLRDFDSDEERFAAIRARIKASVALGAPEPAPRPMITVDLAAIEAELLAA